MPHYRLKSREVVFEARRLSEAKTHDLAHWCGGKVVYDAGKLAGVNIPTSSRTIRAKMGDYIIKDRWGDFNVCSPDLFESMYEMVLHSS